MDLSVPPLLRGFGGASGGSLSIPLRKLAASAGTVNRITEGRRIFAAFDAVLVRLKLLVC